MPDAPRDLPTRATSVADGALSWVIAGLAWWTVLFHVATPLRWHRDLVAVVWLAGLALAAVLLVVRRPRPTVLSALEPVEPRGRWRAPVLVAAGVGAAALSATRWTDERPAWWIFWAAVVVIAALAATASVGARRRPAGDRAAPSRVPSPAALGVVVGLAVLAALGSALTQREDADDVFLVNRSAYVAEHPGPLPVRDTLFSDEVFAVTRPDTIPTSFEPLVGVVAAWGGVSAPTAAYLLLAPLVSAAAVLALWRMLRTLGAVAPVAATAAACAFLLLDGGIHYSHGNFHFARAWQGKVVFLMLVVPALWHHGLRWARDGSRRDLGLLLGANVAGIGLSTTAAVVAPPITLVAVAGGALATRRWHRVLPGMAAMLPGLLAAGAFALLPRQDPSVGDHLGSAVGPFLAWIPPWFTLSDGINPGRQWHWVFDGGWALLVPVAAAFTAWAFVRDRAARLALALAPLFLFGVYYGPGTLDAIAELTGVRVILWRTSWILPVPAAVGLLATAPLLLRDPVRRTVLAVVVPVAVLGTMALGSTWVLDRDNLSAPVGGLRWDVDPTDRTAAQHLLDLSEPGDLVLAPETIGGAIAIQTTRIRAVNPRGQYMAGRHTVPEFHAEERILATHAASVGIEPHQTGDLVEAVETLGVDTACITRGLGGTPVSEALEQAGLRYAGIDDRCEYWRRG